MVIVIIEKCCTARQYSVSWLAVSDSLKAWTFLIINVVCGLFIYSHQDIWVTGWAIALGLQHTKLSALSQNGYADDKAIRRRHLIMHIVLSSRGVINSIDIGVSTIFVIRFDIDSIFIMPLSYNGWGIECYPVPSFCHHKFPFIILVMVAHIQLKFDIWYVMRKYRSI
jgi:hypothetical protein